MIRTVEELQKELNYIDKSSSIFHFDINLGYFSVLDLLSAIEKDRLFARSTPIVINLLSNYGDNYFKKDHDVWCIPQQCIRNEHAVYIIAKEHLPGDFNVLSASELFDILKEFPYLLPCFIVFEDNIDDTIPHNVNAILNTKYDLDKKVMCITAESMNA